MDPRTARGDSFQQTDTGSTSATATEAAASGKTHLITHVTASSDKAGSRLQVKDGTTLIWDVIVGDGNIELDFSGDPLECTAGNKAEATIDSTASAKVNLKGRTIG